MLVSRYVEQMLGSRYVEKCRDHALNVVNDGFPINYTQQCGNGDIDVVSDQKLSDAVHKRKRPF